MADGPALTLEGDLLPAEWEDDRLVEQFAPGDRSGFDALVAAHQERVSRLAHRLLGWPSEVDDVVQEVFLAAWKGLPGFRSGSSLSTWLTSITINQCRSRRRRLRRLLFGVRVAERRCEHGRPADGEAMDAETYDRVHRAVAGLSPPYREVVVLCCLEEMSAQAVADLLGITASTVAVRLHRAREKLKGRLSDLIPE